MRRLICLILLAVVVMTLFTGCVQEEEKIKGQEEAAEAITDIGQDVEDIGATLEEIDEDLGGE